MLGSSGAFPSGKRFVLLPTLGGPLQWFPTQYTPKQVLEILEDLHPDVLHRYLIAGVARHPDAVVPGSDPPMTVKEFAQASVDASKSVIVPMVSLDTYERDQGLFFEQTRTLASLPIDPPMTMLSIDLWYPFLTAHGSDAQRTMDSILDALKSQGWKGFEVGACGAPQLRDGTVTFSLFCVNPSTWEPDLSMLKTLRGKSVGSVQLMIDWPPPMAAFTALPPDRQEQLLTKYAQGQGQSGYRFIYPIVLVNPRRTVNYDSPRIRTSRGETMYQVMKRLMDEYD